MDMKNLQSAISEAEAVYDDPNAQLSAVQEQLEKLQDAIDNLQWSAPVTTTLERIEVTTPNKTEYQIGDKLNTDGLTVTAYYSDGSSKLVTDYVVTGFDSSKAGQVTVTVEYDRRNHNKG